MNLTRRAFARGSAALAAAAILPKPPAAAQGTVLVRRSIGDLIREQSPLIEAYRRGVDETARIDSRRYRRQPPLEPRDRKECPDGRQRQPPDTAQEPAGGSARPR